jgi:hypothetical protein
LHNIRGYEPKPTPLFPPRLQKSSVWVDGSTSGPRDYLHHKYSYQAEERNVVYHDLVTSSLEELTDRDFHERLWFGKIPGMVGSYVEAVEGLFTDSGLSDALKEGPVYSAEIDDLFGVLSKQLRAVDEDQYLPELIADPAFARARETAQSIRDALASRERDAPKA